MKSKYFSCCRIPLPSTVHVQKVHVPCGCFSICSPVCISIKKGFVLFVSPLIGCAGRSIPHCEFSVSLPASRASHRLCTRSMASAASASFPAQPRAAHRARPASMPMCSASGAGRRSVEGPWPHAALTGFLSSRLPPIQILQRASAVPPARVLDGLGPLGAVHGPVRGRHPSAPQDLRERAGLRGLQRGESRPPHAWSGEGGVRARDARYAANGHCAHQMLCAHRGLCAHDMCKHEVLCAH